MLRFDDDEWMKFLVMYEQTDVKAKAVFAKARIFGEPFKVLREDRQKRSSWLSSAERDC